jgi:hypothetical protein
LRQNAGEGMTMNASRNPWRAALDKLPDVTK